MSAKFLDNALKQCKGHRLMVLIHEAHQVSICQVSMCLENVSLTHLFEFSLQRPDNLFTVLNFALVFV